eukprot:1160632-Pelagomonas_calceolata.AAC.7
MEVEAAGKHLNLGRGRTVTYRRTVPYFMPDHAPCTMPYHALHVWPCTSYLAMPNHAPCLTMLYMSGHAPATLPRPTMHHA